ncbi:MAG: hypothetical protein CMH83_18840 [Nocardioides sp.]|nr:hypothetical protein [Nocardioides sp.]
MSSPQTGRSGAAPRGPWWRRRTEGDAGTPAPSAPAESAVEVTDAPAEADPPPTDDPHPQEAEVPRDTGDELLDRIAAYSRFEEPRSADESDESDESEESDGSQASARDVEPAEAPDSAVEAAEVTEAEAVQPDGHEEPQGEPLPLDVVAEEVAEQAPDGTAQAEVVEPEATTLRDAAAEARRRIASAEAARDEAFRLAEEAEQAAARAEEEARAAAEAERRQREIAVAAESAAADAAIEADEARYAREEAAREAEELRARLAAVEARLAERAGAAPADAYPDPTALDAAIGDARDLMFATLDRVLAEPPAVESEPVDDDQEPVGPEVEPEVEPEPVTEVEEPEAEVDEPPHEPEEPEAEADEPPHEPEDLVVDDEPALDVPALDEPAVDEPADPADIADPDPDAATDRTMVVPAIEDDATQVVPAIVVDDLDDARADEPVPAAPAASTAAPRADRRTGRPYRAVRRGVSGWVGALLAVAAAGAAVYLFLTDGDQAGTAVALLAVALLGALFAYRRIGTSSEVLLSEAGELRLVVRGHEYVFDLATEATRLDMQGQPGDRDWEVQVHRKAMAPVIVDGGSVDPPQFTDALRQWRPDL